MFCYVGCFFCVGHFIIGMDQSASLFLGFALSMSSTTVVIKSLEEAKLSDTVEGQVISGLLVVQDFSLAFILAFLPVFDHREGSLMWKLGEFT
eukprot:UN21794